MSSIFYIYTNLIHTFYVFFVCSIYIRIRVYLFFGNNPARNINFSFNQDQMNFSLFCFFFVFYLWENHSFGKGLTRMCNKQNNKWCFYCFLKYYTYELYFYCKYYNERSLNCSLILLKIFSDWYQFIFNINKNKLSRAWPFNRFIIELFSILIKLFMWYKQLVFFYFEVFNI